MTPGSISDTAAPSSRGAGVAKAADSSGAGTSPAARAFAEAGQLNDQLLFLGLDAGETAFEPLDLGVLVFERTPEGVALGARRPHLAAAGRCRLEGRFVGVSGISPPADAERAQVDFAAVVFDERWVHSPASSVRPQCAHEASPSSSLPRPNRRNPTLSPLACVAGRSPAPQRG